MLIPLTAVAAAPTEIPAIVTAEPALREVTLTGFTRARARLPLVSESQGRVLEVGPDIGEPIPENGIFSRIDDVFIRLELDEIAVEQGRLRAQVDYDEREAARYRELARNNNAAAAQLDTAEQTLRNNRDALRMLAVKRRVLEERQRRTRVIAPPGWRVTERAVEPGQWVSVGERLGEAADFAPVIVPFALTPEELAVLNTQIVPSQLRLELPDLEETADVSIYRTHPGFDPETRKIAVDLVFDGALNPGRGGLRTVLRLPMPERSG
ncbi:MAG: HlyD family efflux transporter periplasmic adaptor subunit, partial [Thiohalocapsa sp.]